MQLLLYDDDITYVNEFEKTLESCEALPQDWTLHFASNKENLYKILNEQKIQPNIVFMDIELDGDNGIEVAKEIKEMVRDIHVVFLTHHITYASDVYEIDHDYFVVKSELSRRLDAVFRKIKKCGDTKKDEVVIKEKTTSVIVSKREIMYCTKVGRQTVIYLENGKKITCTLKMDELENKLDDANMMRCHKSYLVSLDYVSSYSRAEIVVCEKHSIPISRAYIGTCKERFHQWVEENI